MDTKNLLRQIPKVDILITHPILVDFEGNQLTHAIRKVLEILRADILSERVTALPELDVIVQSILKQLKRDEQSSLRPVLNATGVILHTNLGRALLSERAIEQVISVASNYNTLEYDTVTGGRGHRHAHVEKLLTQLTGAEAAMVVNNNAAAVMLILNTVSKGKEVIISRGELVEIGGSFRIPDVMSESGAILREVGTTNKTHLTDYENAISEHTGALLKVHTSNYRIIGFTASVDLEPLVALGERHGIPVIDDLGSGALYPLERFGLDEPLVKKSVSSGVDITCFSGDKLLGGPQAGIIVGKKEWIERLRKHPLARALRIDKLTLAALEGTLRDYLDEDAVTQFIPVLAMISSTPELLRERADALLNELHNLGLGSLTQMQVVEDEGMVGGGSLPEKTLRSYAVALMPKTIRISTLEEVLRMGNTPLVGHIQNNEFRINVLTLKDTELMVVGRIIKEAFEALSLQIEDLGGNGQ